MKVEVAAETPISVLVARFFAEYAIAELNVFAIMYLIGRENKRMDWVQGMVQPKSVRMKVPNNKILKTLLL